MESLDLVTLRVLSLIFSVSVWHEYANELISGRTMCPPIGFFVFYLFHFVWLLFDMSLIRSRVLSVAFVTAIVNVLFGSWIIMSLKPHDWFYSFRGECLISDDNYSNRMALFAYVLIVCGALEVVDNLRGVWQWLFAFLFFFGACTLMVWLNGGF